MRLMGRRVWRGQRTDDRGRTTGQRRAQQRREDVVERMRENQMCEPPNHWMYCPPGPCACGQTKAVRVED